jgi:DNA polymerase-3 subunit delta
LVDWIRSYCKKEKIKITDSALFLVSEYIGNNLTRIANEFEKIFINESKETTLDENHINKYIGENKEYNAFEFIKAVGKRDVFKTHKIINYFAENEKDHPLIPILSNMYSFFAKVLVARSLNVTDKNDAMAKMNMSYPQAMDCVETLKKYNDSKLFQIISLIREADLKSKGYESGSMDSGAILREMVIKIFAN